MDKNTRLAIPGLLEALRESMKSTSETKILSLPVHDALVEARVPGDLEAYECSFDRPPSELKYTETISLGELPLTDCSKNGANHACSAYRG